MFEKIILDTDYMFSLERICLQEGFAEPGLATQKYFEQISHAPRNMLKSRTLLLLTLFEEIDGPIAVPDIGKLEDYGILHPEAQLLKDGDALPIPHNHPVNDAARELIRTIVLCNKKRLLCSYAEPNSPWRRWAELDKAERRTLMSSFDACLEMAIWDIGGAEVRPSDPLQPNLEEYIEGFVIGTWESLKMALYENVQVACTYSGGRVPVQSIPKQVDELLCVARASLRDEIRVLPRPSSLREVIDLRQSTEIRRFREVLSEWVVTVQEGREKAEKRIRRDVALANRDLRHLESWAEYKTSPLAFWITAIGGHIPIFSNILTLVSTFGDLAYTRWLRKRSNWALLLR